ncbi:MAG: hypothetical protein ACREVG_03960, partial [Burkholderiales bacterium]
MTRHGSGSLPALSDVLVFAGALLVFGAIVSLGIATDLQLHAELIQRIARGQSDLPLNFIYYLTIYALSLFNAEARPLLIATAVALAVAVVAKFRMSTLFFGNLRFERHPRDYDHRIVLSICALLLIAFSLPVRNLYIGQI